jgi:polyisoprenoid-binding protein YceI
VTHATVVSATIWCYVATSTEVTGTTDDLRIVGELSLAGTTRQLEARGKLRGPIDTGAGDKLAISLEVTIDRTDYGMNWQMELPSGGVALANEVKLLADLEFGRD